MELEEFKELWKSKAEQDILKNEITSEKINLIIMKTTDTLSAIKKTNNYWYKLTKMNLLVLIGVFAVSILVNFLVPNKFHAFREAMVYNFILFVVILLSMVTYNYQRKIFESPDHDNLALSLKSYIKKFNTFYIVTMSAWTPITAIILFMAINLLAHTFKTEVSTFINLIISGITTLIVTIAGHIYYKKTYLKWINALKSNLKELQGEK